MNENDFYFLTNIKLNPKLTIKLQEHLNVIISDEKISEINAIILSESKIIEKDEK